MNSIEISGLQELKKSELATINGGYWYAALLYFLYESAANPQESANAFMDGYNSARN